MSEPRIPRPAHGSRGDGLPGALRGVRAVFGRPSGELVDHPGEGQQLPGGASPVAVALDARPVRRTVVQLRQPERPGTHEVAHVALAHHPFRLPHHRQAHKRVRPVRSHSSRRARPRSRHCPGRTVTGTVTRPVERLTPPARQRPVRGRSSAVREDRLGLLRGGHLHGARSERFKRRGSAIRFPAAAARDIAVPVAEPARAGRQREPPGVAGRVEEIHDAAVRGHLPARHAEPVSNLVGD